MSQRRWEGGSVWAPRQAGKTWLLEQVRQEVPECYGDRFAMCSISFETLHGLSDTDLVGLTALATEKNLAMPPALRQVLEAGLPGHPQVETWFDFSHLFSRYDGLWERSLLLLIDEIDAVPPCLSPWRTRRSWRSFRGRR